MTLKAYQNAQRVVEDPRATEYRLFGQVTGALLECQEAATRKARRWSKRSTGIAACGAPWRPTAWTTATP